MKTNKLIAALIAGGLVGLAPASLFAAGLGRLTVQSSLGQPLQADIELLSVQKGEADSLTARMASPDAFQDAKIDYSAVLNAVRFGVEKRPNGQPYLRLTTSQPMNDPFVDMLVELTWASGHLVREFPMLLDPPGFASAKLALEIATVVPAQSSAREPSQRSSPPAVLAPTAAADSELGADQYTVKAGDTLYRIASEVKPAGVDLDRLVVALFRENRQAFISDNMNLLKSGSILRVPSTEQANTIPQNEATRDIRAQTADWNAYRNKLAGQVAAAPVAPDTATQSAAGKIGQASIEQPGAAAAGAKDLLKLSKGAEGKAGTSRDATANALREEAIASENQVKEEKIRVAQLEKNIQEMQQLLAMKTRNMAELQKQAEVGKAPQPGASVGKPVEAKPGQAKPPAETNMSAANLTLVAATDSAVPSAQAKPASGAVPVADAKPKGATKTALTPPAPEAGFVDQLVENPLLPIAGAGVLLLAGFLGYSTYRRRKATVPATGVTSSIVTDLKSGMLPNARSSSVVDTGNSSFLTDFEKTGPGMIDVEEVDPVAEAEVYIAYGRDTQAEEILKEAMAKDGSRHEIPLKLLEIYAARKSAASFAAVAKDLHRAAGEGHPVWNHVAEMGRKLDPSNALYALGAPAAPPLAKAAEPLAWSPAEVQEKSPAIGEPVHRDQLDFDLNPAAQAAEHPSIESRFAAPPLDLSLEPEPQEEVSPDDGLDFDFGDSIGTPVPMDKREEPPAAEQTQLVRPKFASQFTDDDLDLSEFDAGEKVAAAAAYKGAAARLDMPLPGLTLSDNDAIIPAAIDTSAKRPAPSMDFGGLNLDLSPTPGLLEGPADDEANGEWHSVATKLDLARAYLEIGDKDGAREILHEVIQEGDGEQKREAETLTAALV